MQIFYYPYRSYQTGHNNKVGFNHYYYCSKYITEVLLVQIGKNLAGDKGFDPAHIFGQRLILY